MTSIEDEGCQPVLVFPSEVPRKRQPAGGPSVRSDVTAGISSFHWHSSLEPFSRLQRAISHCWLASASAQQASLRRCECSIHPIFHIHSLSTGQSFQAIGIRLNELIYCLTLQFTNRIPERTKLPVILSLFKLK